MEFPSSESPQEVVLQIESDLSSMTIIKNRNIALMCKVLDANTKLPMKERRFPLEFRLVTAKSNTDLTHSLLFHKVANYAEQVTNSDGELASNILIKDVSRKHEKEGFCLIAKITNTEITCRSPAFLVISKQRSDLKPTKLKRMYDQIQDLETKLENMEKRLKILESPCIEVQE